MASLFFLIFLLKYISKPELFHFYLIKGLESVPLLLPKYFFFPHKCLCFYLSTESEYFYHLCCQLRLERRIISVGSPHYVACPVQAVGFCIAFTFTDSLAPVHSRLHDKCVT